MTIGYRVAIIGAGPAGFFAAEQLLASETPRVDVDMFDRLPTPWGLVRAGVAPDHPKIKSVSAQFAEVAEHPRYRFFGHVEFGRDVSRSDLLSRYDAVLYSIGARSERRLDIPGEDLPGSLAAADFVAWYNGHPDMAGLNPDLSGTHAVVVGNGNVALDVARMLLLSDDRLRQTDMADHAVEALACSNIRDVTLLGRRGPVQGAFTSPELREIVTIDGLDVEVDAELLVVPDYIDPADKRRTQRNLAVLKEAAERDRRGGKRLRFGFLRSPIAIEGLERAEEMLVGVNDLAAAAGQVQAVDTGIRERLKADLIVRAVGYRGLPLPGVAFDERSGIIPNKGGAVIGGEREYVAGWIKRGPTGIIGTNRADAVETADRLLTDLASAQPGGVAPKSICDWLDRVCPDNIDHAGWLRIDAKETSMGDAADRPRVKLVAMSDMLATARSVEMATGQALAGGSRD